MTNPSRPWSNRLLQGVVGLLAVALLLRWVWLLIEPVVPVVAVVVGVVAVGWALLQRQRRW